MIADLSQTISPLLEQAAGLMGLAVPEMAHSPVWQAFQVRLLDESVRHCLQQQADLDPLAQELLQDLPMLVVRVQQQGVLLWRDQTHPVRRFGEMLVGAVRGVDDFSGRNAKTIIDLVPAALQKATADLSQLEKISEQFAQSLRQYQQDLKIREQQLIQKEREQWKLADARVGVDSLLQQQLGERSLPTFAVEFLENDFRKLLQVAHVQHGSNSERWQKLQELLVAIIWSLSEAESESLRSEYRQRISEPQAQLREWFGEIHHNAAALDRFIEQWDEYALALLSGYRPSLPATQLDLGASDHREWMFTDDALLKARAIRVGDWVVTEANGKPVRARLIDKDLHQGHYLFANLSGLRIASFSTEQLADAFATQRTRLIDPRPFFLQWQQSLLEQLEEQLARLHSEKAEAEARNEAEKIALQKAALEKAQAKLAAERERRQAEVAARAKEQARARLLAECLSDVQRLQPGAWLQLNTDTLKEKAQLAFILNRSNELVFVNAEGKKVLQATATSVAEMLADQKANVQDYGRVLDDALATLVQGRREHLKNWQ